MQPSSEYAHTPIETGHLGAGRCAECGELYPCRAQQIHAQWAARELAAYFRETQRQTEYGPHAGAIAAAEAA